MKNIVIIGGGAAGFFAAIRSAENNPDASVTILERGKDLLQKVKISGGGRCNVTHACWSPKELIKYYPRGEKALLGPFHQFSCGDTVDWFENRGINLKIEDDGRIFPKSNNSETIVEALMEAAIFNKVKVLKQQRVSNIKLLKDGSFEVSANDIFHADKLIITAGSSPAIWAILENMGHQISSPVPSLFTFNIKDQRLKDLSGLSVSNAKVEVLGKKELQTEGPLLITHWGMSGPGILKLSSWGARWMYDCSYKFKIRVNWTSLSTEEIRNQIIELKLTWAKRQVRSNPYFEIPGRLWNKLCEASNIPEKEIWANLNKAQINNLILQISSSEWQVSGKSTFKEEFVTAGGVNLNEINFKKFESKIIPNLFLAGEILDIDALTGGFNFQAAWTGAWIIGENV